MQPEAVNLRMTKGKRAKGQTMIYKTSKPKQLRIEQHESH
jgi:hypothetical protein